MRREKIQVSPKEHDTQTATQSHPGTQSSDGCEISDSLDKLYRCCVVDQQNEPFLRLTVTRLRPGHCLPSRSVCQKITTHFRSRRKRNYGFNLIPVRLIEAGVISALLHGLPLICGNTAKAGRGGAEKQPPKALPGKTGILAAAAD